MWSFRTQGDHAGPGSFGQAVFGRCVGSTLSGVALIDPGKFDVRSAFARSRAHELAKRTGMTATQVVEDALRSYVPPGDAEDNGRFVRKGRLLVRPAAGTRVTLEEANDALDTARDPRPGG